MGLGFFFSVNPHRKQLLPLFLLLPVKIVTISKQSLNLAYSVFLQMVISLPEHLLQLGWVMHPAFPPAVVWAADLQAVVLSPVVV
jgi:hypothetical protein